MPLAAFPINYKEVPAAGNVVGTDLFPIIREQTPGNDGKWKLATGDEIADYVRETSTGIGQSINIQPYATSQDGNTMSPVNFSINMNDGLQQAHQQLGRCFLSLDLNIVGTSAPFIYISGVPVSAYKQAVSHDRPDLLVRVYGSGQGLIEISNRSAGDTGGGLGDTPLSTLVTGRIVISGSYLMA